MARPLGDQSKRRSKLFPIRLSVGEVDALKRAAAADDRSVSAWARIQLLKAAGHKAAK